MVKKVETIVTLTDDLDGSKADRTLTFGFDGVTYEIDLSKKNANGLEKSLAPYVAAARKVPARGRPSGSNRAGASRRAAGRRADLGEVREWARANGHDVSDRGRVPAAVLEAYDTAR
jgi:hypothetical protein